MMIPGIGGFILGGGYRFIKVEFVTTNGVMEVFEINLYDVIGGSDILSGLTITASNEDTGASHFASKAHDADLATYWSGTGSVAPAYGTWLKFAAPAGLTINPKLFHMLPRVFVTDQFPTGIKVSGSNDDVTYVTLLEFTTEASFTRYIDFEPRGPDPTGYRYLWLEIVGNNFSGADPSYIRWIDIFGAEGQNLALQSVDFIGTKTTNQHSVVFSGGYQTSELDMAIGSNVGIDLGKQRTQPVSVRLSFSATTLFAQHGIKNWRLVGANVNNIASGTTILAVNDLTGAPAANEVRTYNV